MFSTTYALAIVASLGVVAQAFSVRSPNPAIHKRALTGQNVAFACFGGGGDCECPLDSTGEQGVLINVFPGFQCAYPSGACTWDDATGVLTNPSQGNCPTAEACTKDHGCICPADLIGDAGVLIFQFTGYQCAYATGSCTYDFFGNLQSPNQGNCLDNKPCVQSGGDS
ncbi:hypothetical protein PsYK624_123600 [Phanerochaete sordida]|uniref:Uncharacterized protein n=1 Tax=Phanerochaete sordida TaxID=48140 RepID=A0A9P3GJ81_9APHY|nr:hypothetical protein PsYK624_123600 [Phanerochaete sordida]